MENRIILAMGEGVTSNVNSKWRFLCIVEVWVQEENRQNLLGIPDVHTLNKVINLGKDKKQFGGVVWIQSM